MKKFLILTLSLLLSVLVIVSCGDDDKKSEKPSGGGELIWGQSTENVIIFDGNATDVSELATYIGGLTGKIPAVKTAAAPEGKNEIIIGETGRAVSKEAYRRLDRMADLIEISSRGESAYLIYADGGSLAIAYSDVIGRVAAFEYIYGVKSEEYAQDGIVAYSCFDTADFVASSRDAEREVHFAELEQKLGSEAVDAMRELYSLYDESLYIWLANLYDPVSGGFYYSASARNNEGFLADLESTGQALAIMDNSGLSSIYDGSWAMLLPDDIKAGLLNFAREMQDEDGYFYHPQWGKNISTSRRGRDAGWARDIIEGLGEEPYYPYISDRIDDAAVSLTERLGTSSVVQVSSVVSVAATDPELKSEAAFRQWLDDAKIYEDSYSTFHNLSSRISAIKKAGLWDFLLDYLREHQYDNGLWEPTVSYNSVNGLMKVSGFFGKKFPNPEAAITSAMAIMQMDALEQIEGITFVYNPWVCIYNIINSCESAQREYFRDILKENAPALIAGTMRKLAAFRREDGGFSYHQDKTSSVSQGELVAVDGTKESDVNATGMAISTVVKYMLRVYQITPPPLYYENDSLYFLSTIESLGEIVKDESVYEEPELITFDNYDPAYGEEEYGVVKKPHDAIKNYVGDAEILGDSYAWFTSQVVQNPDPESKKGDLVLYAKDMIYPDFNKTEATTQSSTIISFTNASAIGNCYVLELDMWCDEIGTTNAPVMQIMYHRATTTDNSMWVNLYSYEKDGETYLRIEDNFVGLDGVKDTATAGNIPVGRWFNLRVEAYKFADDSGKLKVRIKFYVNGEFAGECDSSHTTDGEYTDFTINAVKLAYYRTDASAFYLNNIYASKMTKAYAAGNTGSAEPLGPVEYDFESGEVTEGVKGYTYSTQSDNENRETYTQTNVDSTEMDSDLYGLYYTVATDPKNPDNKVLKLSSKAASSATAGTIRVYPTVSATGRVHIVEYDYMLVSNSVSGSSMLGVNFLDSLGLKIGGMATASYNITSTATYDRGVFQIGNTIAGADGVNTLDANLWYKVRIAWDQDTNVIRYLYSVDGGKNWYQAAKDGERKSATRIGSVEIVCNTYNNTGVQYLDNISYTVTDTLPTAKSGAPDMDYDILVTPGGNTVYDFETGVLESGEHINVNGHAYHTSPSLSANPSYKDETDHIVYDSVDSSGIYNGKYGVAMSIVADPTSAANKVLKMSFVHSGSVTPSVITVASSTVDDTADVSVLEFDYYLDYQTMTGSTTPFKIQFHDELDRPIGSSFNFIQQLSTAVSAGEREGAKKAFRGNGVSLYSKTWYRIRIIWDRSEGKLDFYYSTDEAATFIKMGETKTLNSSAYASSVSLHFTSYNWNGVQYLDNLSYKNIDAVPSMTLRVPTPEELGVAVSGGSKVYDFETGALETGSHLMINGHLYDKLPGDSDYVDATHHHTYDSVGATGAGDGKLGVSLSIISDPSRAVGKVLKLNYTAASGIQSTTVSVGAGTLEDGASVAVLEFDYYLISQIHSSSNTDASVKIVYNTAGGDQIGKALGVIAPNLNPVREGYPSVRAFSYNGSELYSSDWYRFRIVWDIESGRVYYYFSEDEGATYILAGEAIEKTETDIPDSVNLEFSAKSWEGVQYIDNLSFKVLATAPSFTEGTPIARPISRPTNLGPTSYDFETGDVTDGIFGYTYSTQTAGDGRETFVQTNVSSNSTPAGAYGLHFSLAADPKSSANKVIALTSEHAGGATPSTITLYPTLEREGNVHIVEYDYYFESNTKATKATMLGLSFLNLVGEKIGGSLTLAYNLTTARDSYIGAFQMGTTSTTADGRSILDAGRWYRMRVVWNKDDGTLSYLYSVDGGTTWYRACSDGSKASSTDVLAVQFVCNTYNNRGTQYLDNLIYKITDTVPEVSSGAPDVDYGTVGYGGGVTYDFETDTQESGEFISILGNAYNADGEKIAYSTITSAGIGEGLYGTSMSISSDPTEAANRALKVITQSAENAEPSVITIGSKQSDKSARITVLELDYYLESQGELGDSAGVTFDFLDEHGGSLVGAFGLIESLDIPSAVGADDDSDKAFSVNGRELFSKIWYRIRIVLDRKNETLSFYASDDGGETFEALGVTRSVNGTQFVTSVKITVSSDKRSAVQYLDNISLGNVSAVPTYTKGELRDPRPAVDTEIKVDVSSNSDKNGWDVN